MHSLLKLAAFQAFQIKAMLARACEIEALELEHKRSAEQAQMDAGAESQTGKAVVEPKPTRPGRKPDETVKRRREIVSKSIMSQADFHDNAKLKDLFSKLDEAGIPLPEKRRPPGGWRPENWVGLLKKPNSEETQRMLRYLRRDRFPKRKNVPEGTL